VNDGVASANELAQVIGEEVGVERLHAGRGERVRRAGRDRTNDVPFFDKSKDECATQRSPRTSHADPHVNLCRTTALLGRVSQSPNAPTPRARPYRAPIPARPGAFPDPMAML
jgi:hypothetical protein